MASTKLVKLARAAAKSSRKAMADRMAWEAAFEAECGHNEMSDELVEAIEYGMSDEAKITADFIDQHSAEHR